MLDLLTGEDRQLLRRWRSEMAEEQSRLGKDWCARLKKCQWLQVSSHHTPSRFLMKGGGFWLSAQQYDELGNGTRQILKAFGSRSNGGWLTRGYTYYAADAHMHLPELRPPVTERWAHVASRWARHAGSVQIALSELGRPPIALFRWVVLLGVLEWILNDLASARWLSHYAGIHRSKYEDILDDAIDVVAGVFADVGWHLWQNGGDFKPDVWGLQLTSMLESAHLASTWSGLWEASEQAGLPPDAVRAVREGDEAWLVAAAVERQILPLMARHEQAKYIFAGEAFGALTMGSQARNLLPLHARSQVVPVVVRNSVHEVEMGRASDDYWPSLIDTTFRIVIHLDDSVFTGRTHAAFRERLIGQPAAIYLVSTTLDVGTPYNHPEEMLWDGLTTSERLAQTESNLRSVAGRLPIAASHWARSKGHGAKTVSKAPASFQDVIEGSDRLYAMLWQRYSYEICHG